MIEWKPDQLREWSFGLSLGLFILDFLVVSNLPSCKHWLILLQGWRSLLEFYFIYQEVTNRVLLFVPACHNKSWAHFDDVGDVLRRIPRKRQVCVCRAHKQLAIADVRDYVGFRVDMEVVHSYRDGRVVNIPWEGFYCYD